MEIDKIQINIETHKSNLSSQIRAINAITLELEKLALTENQQDHIKLNRKLLYKFQSLFYTSADLVRDMKSKLSDNPEALVMLSRFAKCLDDVGVK